MRTDKDIDFSVGQLFQNTACILCRTCPAQIFHLTRHILQTFLESLEVLVSQYRSRHQHRYLLVVGHCLKCSTDSDLRLTKTHVTTDETVHRLITLHIRLYFLSSLQLVRSIFIQETGFQFVLQKAVGTILETFLLFTLRIKFNQITGNILNFRLCPFLDFFPCSCAQLTDTGLFSFFPFILGDFM